jgi:hypothetical protein
MSTPQADVAPWIERLARVGYSAKSILYITIGYLASKAALGQGGRLTDTQGALQEVHTADHGQAVLFIIAIGLLGYAAWRLVQAALDPERRGSGVKGILLRIGFALRGLFHAGLGIAAIRIATGNGGASGRGQAPQWTARAFELPGGELLVWAAAAWITGYGIYQFYRASSPKMRRHLQLTELPDTLRTWVLGVSRFGIAARGVVFCLIGLFLLRAAWRHDASQAGGLGESLRAVARFGHWPFLVVAFGLVAYGVYELVNARYRSIRVV